MFGMRTQNPGEFINNHSDSTLQRAVQRKHYRSGGALRGHCASAHGGQVDPECRACREIQERMADLGVDNEHGTVVI